MSEQAIVIKCASVSGKRSTGATVSSVSQSRGAEPRERPRSVGAVCVPRDFRGRDELRESRDLRVRGCRVQPSLDLLPVS